MIAPLLLMLSCAKPVPPPATEPPSALALPALRGPVAALPGPQDTVRRIAFGSCANQNTPMPIMQSIRDRKPDVFVMLGDNVYGDADSGDPSLPELREAYATLAQHKDFRPLTQEIPVLPIWDDHDYGDNDGEAISRSVQKRSASLNRSGVSEAPDPRSQREGVYGAWSFGPEGQRVRLLLLDTRSFRSALTPIPRSQRPKVGRYIPSEAEAQEMLGAEQWQWLETRLLEPADLRIVVSSIQVLAENHGWERWGLLPAERSRLLALLHKTPGVVIVSGDRHWSSMYRDETGLTEMTASSINRPSSKSFTETVPHSPLCGPQLWRNRYRLDGSNRNPDHL